MEQWSFFIVGVAKKGRDIDGWRLQLVGMHSGLMPLQTFYEFLFIELMK